jgi:glyoxylase-like metal-dependent hydrolase (beta-lactamase superfamily II)
MHARFPVVALTGALLAAGALRGEAAMPAERAFRTVEVGPGIYAFLAAETSGSFPSGNVVAIVGEEAVLVVDSGRFPTLACRMIAEIRKKTDKPVKYLVHTHWHLDHIAADAAFREAYPDAIFVSTAFTRRKIVDKQVLYMRDLEKTDAGYVADLEAYLAGGKKRDGSPIPDDLRRSVNRDIADLKLEMAELANVALVAPALTFEKELTVFLGKRAVRLSFLGKGNTAGDTVVIVPDAKVVVTGDLLVAPVPYGYGCHPGEWIATLAKLSALEAAAIVPGHGPVMKDWSYAKQVSELLTALRAQVAEAVAAGATLEETQKRVDLSAFRQRFAGADPGWQAAFDSFFVSSAVARAYQEAKGEMAEE